MSVRTSSRQQGFKPRLQALRQGPEEPRAREKDSTRTCAPTSMAGRETGLEILEFRKIVHYGADRASAEAAPGGGPRKKKKKKKKPPPPPPQTKRKKKKTWRMVEAL